MELTVLALLIASLGAVVLVAGRALITPAQAGCGHPAAALADSSSPPSTGAPCPDGM